MSVTNYTNVSAITAPDGTTVYPGFEDRNGNYFSLDANANVIDTLGRTPVKVTANCNGNSNQVCYDVLNSQFNGSTGTSRYTLTTSTISVQTAFLQSGTTEYSGNLTVVSSIQLPDNSQYSFTYDNGSSGTYGELTGITLPTGGVITYTYITYFDEFNVANRWLFLRNSGGGQWGYVPTKLTQCPTGYTACQKVVVNKPNSDQIEYDFASNTGNYGSWLTNVIYYKSTTTQIASVITSWSTGPTNVQKLTVTSELLDAPSPFPTKTVQYTYISTVLPLVAKVSEWNYYPLGSQPSTPDRITTFTYCKGGPPAFTTTNGPGTQTIAQVNVTYDNYGSNGLTLVSGTTHHDDANYGQGFTARCNPTSVSTLVNGTTYLTTSMTYDTTGQVTSTTDPAGQLTSLSHSDNYYSDNGSNPPASYAPAAPTNAYVTAVTLPIIGSETFGFYYGSGQQAFDTDQNSSTTYYHFQDLFNRETLITFPGGGWNLWQYPSETERDKYIGITSSTPSSGCGTGCKHNSEIVDNLARIVTNALVNDPAGQDTIATSYDTNGRVQSVSNAYRSTADPTYGLQSFNYDALDRVATITRPDGNTAKSYFGSAVGTQGGINTQLCSSATYGLGYPSLSIDEAGYKRETWADGFERIIEVDEPDSTGTLTLNTCYGYDLNDNLTQVVQGSQTRSFSYDAMSREGSATSPEAGTTYFYYTTSGGGLCAGNPALKCRTVDARGITTTLSYDALNRLTSKVYSDGSPTANFFYDEGSVSLSNWTSPALSYTKGHLTHQCTSTSLGSCSSAQTASVYNYDVRGRIINFWQCTPANCGNSSLWQMNYGYDLADDTTSWTHPYGMTLGYTFNAAQQVSQVTSSLSDSTHPGTLATITYTPFGAVSTLVDGCAGSSCTNIQESFGYNNRLQLTMGEIGTSSSPTANSCIVYNYYSSVANPTTCASPGQTTSGNNGSLLGYFYQDTINPTLGHTANFTYDQVKRLASAVATGSSAYNLTYAYDRFGNMACQTNQYTNGPCPNWTFYMATNQISNSGFTYDVAGNLTADGVHTYQWNAEEKLKSMDNGGSTTVYDATGVRSERVVSSSATEYLHDRSGLPIGGASGSTVFNVFVWSLGRMIADYESDGVHFDHVNQINSVSQATDWTGTQQQEQLFYPWGDQWVSAGFQTHEVFGSMPDFDTDLGDYQTRYRTYPPRLGRWLSPDPTGGDISDPQTLNRYSYVLNSPCSATDMLGLSRCIIPLTINDPKHVLTDAQKKYLEQRVQQIFADASSKLGPGDSLGVNFLDNPSWLQSTYSINISSDSKDTHALGETYAPVNFNSSTLYPNIVHRDRAPYSDDAFGRLLGTATAHEIGHGVTGLDSSFNGPWGGLTSEAHPAYDKANENIMMTEKNPNYNLSATGPWAAQKLSKTSTFSPSQALGLFNACRYRFGGGGGLGYGYYYGFLEACNEGSCTITGIIKYYY